MRLCHSLKIQIWHFDAPNARVRVVPGIAAKNSVMTMLRPRLGTRNLAWPRKRSGGDPDSVLRLKLAKAFGSIQGAYGLS